MSGRKINFIEDFRWECIRRGKNFNLCRRIPAATTKELIDEVAINYAIINKETEIIELMGNQLWATLNHFNIMEKFYPVLKQGQTLQDIEATQNQKTVEAAMNEFMPHGDKEPHYH